MVALYFRTGGSKPAGIINVLKKGQTFTYNSHGKEVDYKYGTICDNIKSWSNWDENDYKSVSEKIYKSLDCPPIVWESTKWIEMAKRRKQ